MGTFGRARPQADAWGSEFRVGKSGHFDVINPCRFRMNSNHEAGRCDLQRAPLNARMGLIAMSCLTSLLLNPAFSNAGRKFVNKYL